VQTLDEPLLRDIATASPDRFAFWASFAQEMGVETMAEVGVYRGEFAARVLDGAPGLRRYYMVDPWRHLDDWNKPANHDDDRFAELYRQAMARTDAHAEKRVVLAGTTLEVVDEVADGELDLVYIDGDHTLRGITVDLARWYPKVKMGGFLGGDDFCRYIFQHEGFEPTLVFPYAIYFAEACGARIFALPYRQFVFQKVEAGTHEFVDLVGRYGTTELLRQISWREKRLTRARVEEER
jgi:hypothetical protein